MFNSQQKIICSSPSVIFGTDEEWLSRFMIVSANSKESKFHLYNHVALNHPTFHAPASPRHPNYLNIATSYVSHKTMKEVMGWRKQETLDKVAPLLTDPPSGYSIPLI